MNGKRNYASLRFFYCGRGNTVLVSSGTGSWGLVDCNLSKASFARLRLESLLEKKRVEHLEFVCLTHPHRDHYHGMGSLLKERFHAVSPVTVPCRISEFWDTGCLGVVWALLRRGRETPFAGELEDLIWILTPLIHRDKVVYRILQGEQHASRGFGEFTVHCLSPTLNRLERFRHHSASEIRDSSTERFAVIKEQVNGLSAVLAFVHKPTGAAILLGSDTSAEGWREALRIWADTTNGKGKFQAIKVSHHGARANNWPELYQRWCVAGKTVAILSVGHNDPHHPHPEVVHLLRECGIKPLFTCEATKWRRTYKRDLLLCGKISPIMERAIQFPSIPGHTCADIEVRIMQDGRLRIVTHSG